MKDKIQSVDSGDTCEDFTLASEKGLGKGINRTLRIAVSGGGSQV